MENVIEKQAELKQEIADVSAEQIIVTDQVTYELANNMIGKLQTIKKEVVKRFEEPKRKAQEAHKAICALEKEFLAPVNTKIDQLKTSTVNYYAAEQRRIAAEEERRRKEAEELARLATEAETAGDSETAAEAVAAAMIEEASVTVAPKAKGTSMREVWKAEVIDLDKLPREYMIVNQALLDKVAQASKGALPIPGVKFVKSYINSTRAK